MIGLVVISDGRTEYLERALASVARDVIAGGDVVRWVELDSRQSLEAVGRLAGSDYSVHAHAEKQGQAGIVRAAWSRALAFGVDYLFHVEEDFTFDVPVYLEDLRTVLDADARIAQVVLKRHAWSDAEVAAGGIVEKNPRLYIDAAVGGHEVALHKRGFSNNPNLLPRRTFERRYAESESAFGDELIADGLHFAFMGSQRDAPVCTHIGAKHGKGWRP